MLMNSESKPGESQDPAAPEAGVGTENIVEEARAAAAGDALRSGPGDPQDPPATT